MNFSLLLQQLAGYLIASLVTWAATRYHLTSDQQGILTTDIMGAAGLASATLYGLWTHHRAYLTNPPEVQATLDNAKARNTAASIRAAMDANANKNS